jgi:hypothetical protein
MIQMTEAKHTLRPKMDGMLFKLLIAYGLFSILMLALSMRLWFQVPLTLTKFEFDYFLGLFRPANPELIEKYLLLGRLIHFVLFCIVGYLFLSIANRLKRDQEALSVQSIAVYAAIISMVYAIGMPWVSPDVFFYIGSGWLEGHYGLSPYLHGVSDAAGYMHDQMFRNIYPAWLWGGRGYGPLFQKMVEGVALLSGGNEKVALALFKTLNLGAHAGACWLVYSIAPKSISRLALFSYAANPLILFSVLTCAHNDHLMNVFVLLCLFFLRENRVFLSGCALGVATSIKYFPLVFLPILVGSLVLRKTERSSIGERLTAGGRMLLGFFCVGIGSHCFYPESVRQFVATASNGVPVLRNSIYHVWFMVFPFAEFRFLFKTLRNIYMVFYVTVLALYAFRLKRDWFYGAIEACLVVSTLYFIIVNTGNQEWYLTWLMGLAFLLPGEQFCRFGLKLSAVFMPLVIFTVKNPPGILWFSNLALYSIVLIYGIEMVWHALCTRDSFVTTPSTSS